MNPLQQSGSSERLTRILYLIIPAVVLALDQYTKHLVIQAGITPMTKITVIDGFFFITYVQNPGSAFGLFRDLSDPFRTLFLGGVALFAVGLVIFYSLKSSVKQRLLQVSLHLIFGGALGNLVDRFTQGHVTDFIEFKFWDWYYPSFNIADSAIVSGVILLMIQTLFFALDDEDKEDPASDALSAAADLELSGPRQSEYSQSSSVKKGGKNKDS